MSNSQPKLLQAYLIVLLTLAFWATPSPAAAQGLYVYKTIDDPNAAPPSFNGSGSPYTQAHGINNAGTIVAAYTADPTTLFMRL